MKCFYVDDSKGQLLFLIALQTASRRVWLTVAFTFARERESAQLRVIFFVQRRSPKLSYFNKYQPVRLSTTTGWRVLSRNRFKGPVEGPISDGPSVGMQPAIALSVCFCLIG